MEKTERMKNVEKGRKKTQLLSHTSLVYMAVITNMSVAAWILYV